MSHVCVISSCNWIEFMNLEASSLLQIFTTNSAWNFISSLISDFSIIFYLFILYLNPSGRESSSTFSPQSNFHHTPRQNPCQSLDSPSLHQISDTTEVQKVKVKVDPSPRSHSCSSIAPDKKSYLPWWHKAKQDFRIPKLNPVWNSKLNPVWNFKLYLVWKLFLCSVWKQFTNWIQFGIPNWI